MKSGKVKRISKDMFFNQLHHKVIEIHFSPHNKALFRDLGYTRPRDVDPRLVVHLADKMCCCFPKRCREKCTCGVRFNERGMLDKQVLRRSHMSVFLAI